MYARAVDDAASELRELRREEWADFALGAVALGLALVATVVRPELAIPLFLGGVFVLVIGVKAVWRHWDLLDRLAGERDAHAISEVRAHAAREATMARRVGNATTLRILLARGADAELTGLEDDLAALAVALEDEELALDPASAVACTRLVLDLIERSTACVPRPADELRARVLRIGSAFEPRRRAA